MWYSVSATASICLLLLQIPPSNGITDDEAGGDQGVFVGSFSFSDSLVLMFNSRPDRDSILVNEVLPQWKIVLGPSAQNVQISAQSEQKWITEQTPDGKKVKKVYYRVSGTSTEPIDTEAARQKFDALAVKSSPGGVWAVPDSNGNTVLLSVTHAPSWNGTSVTDAPEPSKNSSVITPANVTVAPQISSNDSSQASANVTTVSPSTVTNVTVSPKTSGNASVTEGIKATAVPSSNATTAPTAQSSTAASAPEASSNVTAAPVSNASNSTLAAQNATVGATTEASPNVVPLQNPYGVSPVPLSSVGGYGQNVTAGNVTSGPLEVTSTNSTSGNLSFSTLAPNVTPAPSSNFTTQETAVPANTSEPNQIAKSNGTTVTPTGTNSSVPMTTITPMTALTPTSSNFTELTTTTLGTFTTQGSNATKSNISKEEMIFSNLTGTTPTPQNPTASAVRVTNDTASTLAGSSPNATSNETSETTTTPPANSTQAGITEKSNGTTTVAAISPSSATAKPVSAENATSPNETLAGNRTAVSVSSFSGIPTAPNVTAASNASTTEITTVSPANTTATEASAAHSNFTASTSLADETSTKTPASNSPLSANASASPKSPTYMTTSPPFNSTTSPANSTQSPMSANTTSAPLLNGTTANGFAANKTEPASKISVVNTAPLSNGSLSATPASPPSVNDSVIEFKVPADWPGNELLTQMKAMWAGNATNDTLPNGDHKFSFQKPPESGFETTTMGSALSAATAVGAKPSTKATTDQKKTKVTGTTKKGATTMSETTTTKRPSATTTAADRAGTTTYGPPDADGMQIVSFKIGDVSVVSVENKKQQDDVLNNQLKPIWQKALGPGVNDLGLNVDNVSPWEAAPHGSNASKIEYSVEGTAHNRVDPDTVRDDFHDKVAVANLPNVLAVPDQDGNLTVLPAAVKVGVTTKKPSGTKKPRIKRTTTTPSPDDMDTFDPEKLPVQGNATCNPLLEGSFTVNDVAVLTISSKRSRDAIINEVLLPHWRTAFAVSDKNFSIEVRNDTRYDNWTGDDNSTHHRVDYTLRGTGACQVNIPAAVDRFIQNISSAAPEVWAVPDDNGTMKSLPNATQPGNGSSVPLRSSATGSRRNETATTALPPTITVPPPSCPEDTPSDPAASLGKRPMFAVSARTDPQMLTTLQSLKSIEPVQSSFGIHKIAISGPLPSLAELEAALTYAWLPSMTGRAAKLTSVAAKVISLHEHGIFSDLGEPVNDVTYVVGNAPVSTSTPRNPFASSSVVIRVPTMQTMADRLQSRNIKVCNCSVYRGQSLHFQGVFDASPLLSSVLAVLKAAWNKHAPQVHCNATTVEVHLGTPYTSVGVDAGRARLTSVPYTLTASGQPWYPSSELESTVAADIASALRSANVSQPVVALPTVSQPVSIDLSFVNYVNGTLPYTGIVNVTDALNHNLANTSLPTMSAAVWNLEPFQDGSSTSVTQQASFVVLPNSAILDPRLYYADTLRRALGNATSSNSSSFVNITSDTKPVYALHFIGQLDEEASLTSALTKIIGPVTVVGYDYGTTNSSGSPQDITEVHLAMTLKPEDKSILPETSSTASRLLESPATWDTVDKALAGQNVSVCRNCSYARARTLNLLQPENNKPLDTAAVSGVLESAWTEANSVSSNWLPLNVTITARDDLLRNENGTAVVQLTYAVHYDQPQRHWYIVQDPDTALLQERFAAMGTVPFVGSLVHL